MNTDNNEDATWGLIQSFHIDTEGYTDRDREMFICGFEFAELYRAARDGELGLTPERLECSDRLIHKDNESRVRMMLGKFKVWHQIEPIDETWSNVTFTPF